jgi:SAM-dependent methyltransferase
MTLDRFFYLLEIELRENPKIAQYHRFTNNTYLYNFRKSYLIQRYQFLIDSIEKQNASILDLGCGYGTTAILLTLLGHKVHGITLEYYFDEIEPRLKYWSQFGDCSSLTLEYGDIFDYHTKAELYDYVVAIDTLHHIEPISKGLLVLYNLLHKEGKIIVSEENGNNFIANIKHIRERGFNRISSYFDERLQKQITFGNENTRSLKGWLKVFGSTSLRFESESLEYIRFYFPKKHNKNPLSEIIEKEQKLWKRYPFLREYFFFGINFTLRK